MRLFVTFVLWSHNVPRTVVRDTGKDTDFRKTKKPQRTKILEWRLIDVAFLIRLLEH